MPVPELNEFSAVFRLCEKAAFTVLKKFASFLTFTGGFSLPKHFEYLLNFNISD
jgi:hypothetical protein